MFYCVFLKVTLTVHRTCQQKWGGDRPDGSLPSRPGPFQHRQDAYSRELFGEKSKVYCVVIANLGQEIVPGGLDDVKVS